MPRNSRNYINTTFFHIMVQGLNKEFIFNKDEDKKQYLKFVNKIKKEVNIMIISYCIMDNHVHILVKTDTINQLSRFMHKVNTLYAIYYNKKYNRVGYVFRDRYKSQIIYSEKQLYTCINYIHNNPVKAQICKFPCEYEYSSYNEYRKNMETFEKDIKAILNEKNTLQEADIIFLEDENEKEEEIQNTIKEYLYANKLNLDTLKKDAEHLRKIIILLKNNYNLSLRKISTYIKVGRETVRIIVKGL